MAPPGPATSKATAACLQALYQFTVDLSPIKSPCSCTRASHLALMPPTTSTHGMPRAPMTAPRALFQAEASTARVQSTCTTQSSDVGSPQIPSPLAQHRHLALASCPNIITIPDEPGDMQGLSHSVPTPRLRFARTIPAPATRWLQSQSMPPEHHTMWWYACIPSIAAVLKKSTDNTTPGGQHTKQWSGVLFQQQANINAVDLVAMLGGPPWFGRQPLDGRRPLTMPRHQLEIPPRQSSPTFSLWSL